MKALDIATQNKVPVFFDPSPIVKRIPKQELHKVIKESQIVFLNERELNLITDSIHSFLKLGCETIVLKQGEKGCSVYHGTEIKHVDTFPTKVIDTTGAGDVFNAGFLLGMTKGWSFESCAKFGNAIAAIKVAKLGAGRNVPTQDEIKKFLELNDSSIPF